MAMAARIATTVVARRNLESLVQRVRTSNCLFFPNRVTAAEAAKLLGNTTRIYGDPPKYIGQDKARFRRRDRPCIPSVSETKFMSSPYSLIDGLQHSTADVISPKLDIFMAYHGEDYHQFFTAHSVEGGHIISPAKYYIYSPFPDFYFAGNTCNGLLLLQNPEWENLVWNPTTHEFKIFPKTFDKLPPGVTQDYRGSGMWCDPSYGFKVMEVVMTELEVGDDEDFSDDPSYHIELYSYRSNSWKKLECQEFSLIGNTGVCINGVFYSRATRKGVEHSEILSFDFSTETLSTIPFPTNRGSFLSYHLEYKGLFTFFARYPADDQRGSAEHEFWVMNKDGSWMRESVFHTCGVGEPLWFSQDGKLLYFSTLDNELVVFDRGTGKLKHLGISMFWGYVKQLIPVVESFAPLHRMLDVEGREKR